MKLGGWTRIWIVASVMYGALVAVVAYDSHPSLASIQRQWISDASAVVAQAISDVEGRYVSPYDVQNKILSKGTEGSLAWLDRVEKTPRPDQRAISPQVTKLNVKYRERISDLSRHQFVYWLQALGWWLGGCALLFVFGWTIGWVTRGFRRSAA